MCSLRMNHWKKNLFISIIIQVISPHTVIPALLSAINYVWFTFLFFLNMTNESKMVMSEQTKNELEFQNLSLSTEVCFPFAWSPADSWPE